MATLFEIQFPESGVRRAVALRVFDAIDAIERELTVYRPDSTISRINAQGGLAPILVDPPLCELLSMCHQLSALTGGAFDITAGPLIKAWGFHRRQGRLPDPEEIDAIRSTIGMQHVRIDRRARTVSFDRPGVEINLGGIGKGYALDRVLAELVPQGLNAALLGAGQSSIRAVGNAPGNIGWPIDIASPFVQGQRLGQLRLENAGLSTSAASEQFFEHAGIRYGHILDPRTGWPAPADRQVTVVAPSAALAEALSTAFYVLGLDWTRDYVAKDPTIGVVYVERSTTRVEGQVTILGHIHWSPSNLSTGHP
jgi:thiamine biosynthesis lipoprotein